MPKLLEELQFPSLSDVIRPKSGLSLYNSNGVLKILHADGTEKIIATGELGEIGLDDYYTKEEIDDLFSSFGPSGFEIIILDSGIFPEIGETGKMYLLPEGETYDEYIYVNNKWEKIGSTAVDLSGYALKSEIPTKISLLENDADFITRENASNSYSLKNETYTKEEVNSLLQSVGSKATFRTWTEV